MAVLSDKDIARELGTKVIIEPYLPKNLGNCSYDVTLGPHYYRDNGINGAVYNPFDIKSVNKTWDLRDSISIEDFKDWYIEGETYCIYCRNTKCICDDPVINSRHKIPKVRLESFPSDAKLIILQPRETILAHTNEFIGGRGNVTTMMKARSSIGRNFIEICKCAGWGDVGYINRWTMEITNNSDYYIPLVVGMRIAQIVFMYTGEVETPYQSKYQTTDDLEQLKKDWQPSDMLPKIYLDKPN